MANSNKFIPQSGIRTKLKNRVKLTPKIDPFNVNGICCLLYNQLYPYLHVLLSGTTPPWATMPHSMAGECPDIFNRLSFRMHVVPRKTSDR